VTLVLELSQILDDVLKTSSPLAKKNDNELVMEFKTDIDFVTADQTRVKQVVLNSITNSLSFFLASGDEVFKTSSNI
jgi:signal transduction histidine kinase